jgi:hypothetical protein
MTVRITALLLAVAGTAAAQMLPPGALNQSATSDPGADIQVDHVIDADGVIHAVWASQVPLVSGSGTDPDIFYSRLEASGWTLPVLVNSYGLVDNVLNLDERHPRLAIAADGTRYCTWQSSHDIDGAGGETDVFAAVDTGSGWGPVEFVNDAADDNTQWVDDTVPTIVLTADDEPLVAWQNYNHVFGDEDIYYSIRDDGSWTAPAELNGSPDGGDDWGPVAMALDRFGNLWAAWSTDNPNLGLGADRDVVYSFLSPGASGWSAPVGVSALAASDSHEDLHPAIEIVDAQPLPEIHFVWSSAEPVINATVGSTGGDLDLAHAVLVPNDLWNPPVNPTFVVNSTATTDAADDVSPSLCVEPGGVLHVGWQTSDAFVGDQDVLTSANATPADGWEPFAMLGLNGLFDAFGEDDVAPDLECGAAGLLSAAWQSNDDLGGAIGADDDILHALGLGKVISRPVPVDDGFQFDTGGDFDPRVVADATGELHAVWTTYDGPTGADFDILYARTTNGIWADPEVVNPWAAADTASDTQPDVAVDSSGVVTVVWASNHDSGGLGSDFDVMSIRKEASGWTGVEVVNPDATTDNGDARPEDVGPQVEIAFGDVVQVVWVDNLVFMGVASSLSWSQRDLPGGFSSSTPITFPSVSGNISSYEFLVGPSDTPWVAWSDNGDLYGTGFDGDIFVASGPGGVWSSPLLIHANATIDADNDLGPGIAPSPTGGIDVVWSSGRDSITTGADRDLWIARANGPFSWEDPVLLHTAMANDSTDENDATVFAISDRLVVGWTFVDTANPSSDDDLAVVALTTSTDPPWSDPIGLANTSGPVEQSPDGEMDIVITRDGIVHMVWDSQDDLGGTVGFDQDVLWAWFETTVGVFIDGFESGDTSAWTTTTP